MKSALLVTTPANIRYLTAFTGEGMVVQAGRRVYLLTDARYTERARGEVRKGVEVRLLQKGALLALVQELGITHLSVEAEHMTLAQYERYASALRGVTLTKGSGVVEKQRMVKTPAELALMRTAGKLTATALRRVVPLLRVGVTERYIAEQIRRTAFDLGADGLSFPSIVAFGRNTAMPHAEPGKARLKKGDTVQIDMGLTYRGYCSDMSRVFFVGAVTAEQRALYAAVRGAQEVGVAKVRPGVRCAAVDAAVREALGSYAEHFTHSTGHGVGIDIHEAPRVSAGEDTALRVGMAVTVEPGVYISKRHGMRVEDTVVVTKEGCEILTPFSKNLVVLPHETALRRRTDVSRE